MADLENDGWSLAFGNVAVFAIACVIAMLSGHPSAIALMG